MLAPTLLHAHNPGPMTGAGNNTYLLAARGGAALLIDAGVGNPRHIADLSSALEAERATLTTVLATHGHADHVGGAAAIATAFPHVRFAKRPWPEMDAAHAVQWTAIDEGDVVAVGDDRLVVLHTPGHSPDHLAFWDEDSRTLFTGDLVTLGSSVMIHWSRGGDLAQYMASLERLLALEPRVILPAHGPRIEQPAAVLQQYLAHRRLRERQVIDALRAGHATVEAIAESIYDGLDAALMAAARENVRAHLEKLRSDQVATASDEGRWRLGD